MLMHVIWTLLHDETVNSPTFSITGVTLCWGDRSPAHVAQKTPFRWHHDAWEARVHVSRAGTTSHYVPAVLRLDPGVWQQWTARAINPRREAARQLADAMHSRGWREELGVVTLDVN